MSKPNNDWDAAISLCGNHYMVTGTYTRDEIRVFRLRLQIDEIPDEFLISIFPGDEIGTFSVWLYRYGTSTATQICHLCATYIDDIVRMAAENALGYIAGMSNVMD